MAIVATTVCLLWAGTGVLAVLTDAATVSGNTFTTAASWGCASPGTQAVPSNADTWIDQASPTQNHGNDDILFLRSKSGSANRRILMGFPLPTLPAGCGVTAATLSVFDDTPTGGRTILVQRAASAWAEGSVTWNTQPAGTGTAASSTSPASQSWQTWTVTTQVQGLYSGSNNGFLLSDQTESAAAGPQQEYMSREDPDDPLYLTVTWA